jgi:hypothetical protein
MAVSASVQRPQGGPVFPGLDINRAISFRTAKLTELRTISSQLLTLVHVMQYLFGLSATRRYDFMARIIR